MRRSRWLDRILPGGVTDSRTTMRPPFRTGKSLVTFRRRAGPGAKALGVKHLSGWQGHARAGVDHLFQKLAHERRETVVPSAIPSGTAALGGTSCGARPRGHVTAPLGLGTAHGNTGPHVCPSKSSPFVALNARDRLKKATFVPHFVVRGKVEKAWGSRGDSGSIKGS